MKWKFWERDEPPELVEARERYEAVEHDDAKVHNLEVRAQRILRENNLAPLVRRALGLQR